MHFCQCAYLSLALHAVVETQIAEHTCRKHSGRVGRTSAANRFSPEAIRLAVAAHIGRRTPTTTSYWHDMAIANRHASASTVRSP
jgi:hypothetical protein